MHDDRTQFCADTFAQHVDELFAAKQPIVARTSGKLFAYAPVTEEMYYLDDETQIRILKQLACTALAAREWFAATASPWALPLPISQSEFGELSRGHHPPRTEVRCMFASSLRYHKWDFLQHPEWRPYVRTLMAHKDAGDYIRRDFNLCQEFPPQKFVELCGHSLYWFSPEMAARDAALEEFRRQLDKGVPVNEARKISGYHPSR